ncbi:hypothetical protein BDV93DRAFT_512761 [Ceratobasidium sp. AG-I]|nr:hypothetical protein BDV93DRAFT_512761 [Ceratobasidium sp. AG-I]
MSVLRQDIQSQTYAYIEQKRLPPGFTDFGGNYGKWQPSAIYTLTDWIRMQQEHLNNGDKSAEESMFQHAQLKDKDGNTYLTVLSYQKEIATEHDLRYSAASAFYYAAISDAEPSYTTRQQEKAITSLVQGFAELHQLYRRVFDLEKLGVPAANDASMLTQPLPHMVAITLVDRDFYEWAAPHSERWNIRQLYNWIKDGGLKDRTTGLLFRGPHGLFRIFLTVLCVHLSTTHPSPANPQNSDNVWEYGENERRLVLKIIDTLRAQVSASELALGSAPVLEPPSLLWDSPWETPSIVWLDDSGEQPVGWSWKTLPHQEPSTLYDPDVDNSNVDDANTDELANVQDLDLAMETDEVESPVPKLPPVIPPKESSSSTEDIPASLRVVNAKKTRRGPFEHPSTVTLATSVQQAKKTLRSSASSLVKKANERAAVATPEPSRPRVASGGPFKESATSSMNKQPFGLLQKAMAERSESEEASSKPQASTLNPPSRKAGVKRPRDPKSAAASSHNTKSRSTSATSG